MYFEFYKQLRKSLNQMDSWLQAAKSYAEQKKFEPDVFVSLRLAPDQFPLSRQIQTACDTAKLSASRLTGKEAPSNPDTETTLEALRARIRSTLAYLDGFTARDFEQAATRQVSQPRWQGKMMVGSAYFVEHALPNFFFHLTHVYAILRHNGVPLGKADFLGELSLQTP